MSYARTGPGLCDVFDTLAPGIEPITEPRTTTISAR